MCPDKDALYWALNENLSRLYRRNYWWLRCWLAGTLKSQREQQRLSQARHAEKQIADLIRDEYGYKVYHTTPNCPFDLWVADEQDHAVRVEVKLSTYKKAQHGGRFQADIRQHADIDLVIWIARARNGQDWHYVIPVADLRDRRNIAIWSECPGNYRGQWSPYLDAWDYLHQIVANTHRRTWQFSLNFPSLPRCTGEGHEVRI